MDILALWDFNDVEGSERRLRAALDDASPTDRSLLRTQIARTYSLRRRFDEAHRELDELTPELALGVPELRVRWNLESGRTYRSAGDAASARPLFEEALNDASAAALDFLAVDAAHMLALVASDTTGHWRGTSARWRSQPRRWILRRASGAARCSTILAGHTTMQKTMRWP